MTCVTLPTETSPSAYIAFSRLSRAKPAKRAVTARNAMSPPNTHPQGAKDRSSPLTNVHTRCATPATGQAHTATRPTTMPR